MTTTEQRPSIYPVLRFEDADRALTFLADAFGFKEEGVHRDEDGIIVHATMSWRGGMFMFSGRKGAGDPFDLGPVCIYVAVEDPDAHHDLAVAAGAEVVMGLNVAYSVGPSAADERVPDLDPGEHWCPRRGRRRRPVRHGAVLTGRDSTTGGARA
jgi:uncharacterized glyoxalase superfamily protein PhnB